MNAINYNLLLLVGKIEKKTFIQLKNKNLMIKLTLRQMIFMGIQLGHLKKNNLFLASWFFYGWRFNIFIINLIKTLFLTRFGLKIVRKVVTFNRPFWFATKNIAYGHFISRYASVCGEPYNVSWWINGSLTNLRMIMNWYQVVLYLMKKRKYFLRHHDKRKLVSSYGFFNQRRNLKSEGSPIGRYVYITHHRTRYFRETPVFNKTFYYKALNNKVLGGKDKQKYGGDYIKPIKFRNYYAYPKWVNLHYFKYIWRKPGGGFIPTVADNLNIVSEFMKSNLPFLTLIDSNRDSEGIMVPIPSNDDSIQCIIFFTYLITRNIFLAKTRRLKKWKKGILRIEEFKYLKYKYVFLKNIEMKKKLNLNERFENLLNFITEKRIKPFVVKNHIIYNMFIPDLSLISKFRDKRRGKFEFFNSHWNKYKI